MHSMLKISIPFQGVPPGQLSINEKNPSEIVVHIIQVRLCLVYLSYLCTGTTAMHLSVQSRSMVVSGNPHEMDTHVIVKFQYKVIWN